MNIEPFIRTVRQFSIERGMLTVEVGTDWAAVGSSDIIVEISFYVGPDEVTPYWNASVFERDDPRADVFTFLADSYGSDTTDLYRFLSTHL